MDGDANESPRARADNSQGNSSKSTPSSQALNLRRRRGLGIVTPNACTECRKKRTKCDGLYPCSRCKSQDIECLYEMPQRQSKDDLRTEIEQLRHSLSSSGRVISALSEPALIEDILMRLWSGEAIPSISDWIAGRDREQPSGKPFKARQQSDLQDEARMQRLASIASQGHNITLGAVTSVPDMIPLRMSQGINPSHGRNSILWPLKEPMPGFSGTWTRVTSDANLIQHLLALYFCWEYPTFASLSKEHYLRDFHDGRKRYCTPLLTNALLALGCRFSNNPEARGDPSNPESSGEHFFTECQRLYYRERDHHTLTTIQAMGVMSIREASCGRIATSEYYAGQCMQLAIEMGLHNTPGPDGQTDEDQAECDVRLATFWGAFTLDNALSSAGSVPRTSHMPSLPPRLPMVEEIERHPWMPYTDDGVPLQLPCVQASNERSVFNCFCELSELVHQSLYLVHNPSRPLAAASLLEVYTKFLLWYDQLPEALRLGQNFTPYVLFVHMYYHFATLLLFWPMSGLRILDAEISPRLVCVQAANAIRTLLESYSKLYTLQRTPSLVPYFVLTAAMVHLAVLTDGGQANYPASRRDEPEFAETTDALEQDIAMLTEMKHCHPFASKALSILSYLTDKWAVNVEIEAGPIPLQDCIEICWPYSRCLQCNPPRGLGSEDASSGFGGNSSQQGALRMTKATIESIQHPLLLPILELRQEMPPTTKVLRQAGFSPLT